MALIKCSECEREISDKAESCPHCGNPMSSRIESQVITKKVEIERTNKKWKRQYLWGVGLTVLGLFVLGKSVGFGLSLLVIGFFTVISSRIGAWWTNG
ncbi:MAG: zinc-ribbon domain-containing protein [Candidatus Paceibacterota bacterium]